ncbi:metal-dependent hydrolase [Synechococcus sp. PCC 6312]|uniref:metal-dependent hydrolase n=1 Tax=Synechococcus sp. (strain ATCC 27167 / PCC 6312) TaxID=195253 RepID=UPI00029F32F8|nr:metal-dependent hydrolase [Synechococcus sp. PCC 6312]AFY61975.1 putative membrane-bound metal-dependent hydrolase [Synechococcus sp. PCC 6312]
MKSITHAVLAATSVAGILGSSNPIILLTAAVASQLPDVDTSKSLTGRILFPISMTLERQFPHRSVTHSFIATAIVAVILSPVLLINGTVYAALMIGYFMGWFGDVFTKTGVAAFYPSQARLVIPGNPHLRLGTNSVAEAFVFAFILSIGILILNINSQGGIVMAFNQFLGLPEGVIEEVNSKGQNNILYVEISGKDEATQQNIRDKFEVVQALTGSDLLVQSEGGILYRAGRSQNAQIKIGSIRLQRGPAVTSESKQVQLEEQPISDLNLDQYPKRTYLTGTVAVADSESLNLIPLIDRYNPVTFQPTRDNTGILRLKSARPQDVANISADVTGNILIRTVVPKE